MILFSYDLICLYRSVKHAEQYAFATPSSSAAPFLSWSFGCLIEILPPPGAFVRVGGVIRQEYSSSDCRKVATFEFPFE